MNTEYVLAEQQFQQANKYEWADINGTRVLVLKNRILMTPGMWNENYYDAVELKAAFQRSNWNEKETVSLFSDHKDNSSQTWIGDVKNVKMLGDNLVGDIFIVDPIEASKVAYGAQFGISPKFLGDVRPDKSVKNLLYKNFSLVFEPACKNTFLNSGNEIITGSIARVKLELNQKETKKLEDMTPESCMAMMVEQGYSTDDAKSMCDSMSPQLSKQSNKEQEQVRQMGEVEVTKLQEEVKRLTQEIQEAELGKQKIELEQKKLQLQASFTGRQTMPNSNPDNGEQSVLTLGNIVRMPHAKILELQEKFNAMEPEDRHKAMIELAQKTPKRERFACYCAYIKNNNDKASGGYAGPVLGKR